MDKMIFTMINSLKSIKTKQMYNAHEISNVITPGFKRAFREEVVSRDISVEGSLASRAIPVSSPTNNVDMTPGALMITDRPLDIYVNGEGALAVIADDGSEHYTRRGDLRLNDDGVLVNGRGHVMMDVGGGSIQVPMGSNLSILNDGMVTMIPRGQDQEQVIGQLKLVNTEGVPLKLRVDGLYDSGPEKLPQDAGVLVTSKALEGSSVNAIDSMVRMIELSRQYEMSVNMLKQVREVDTASASTMRLS